MKKLTEEEKLAIETEKKEVISAFAFRTGKAIEKMVIEATDNLRDTNMMLEALMLGYRSRLSGDALKDYDEYMGINANREGKA